MASFRLREGTPIGAAGKRKRLVDDSDRRLSSRFRHKGLGDGTALRRRLVGMEEKQEFAEVGRVACSFDRFHGFAQ